MTTWRDISDQVTPQQVSQLGRDEDFGETSAAALLFMAREYAAENLAHMVQDAPPEPKLSNAMASSTPVGRRGYTLPSAWEEAVAGWLGWPRLQGVRDTTLRRAGDRCA